MLVKSITVKIYFFFLAIQFYAEAQNTSIEGCIRYEKDQSNISYNQCIQCDENYELNLKKNLCVYKNCSDNQYYDQNPQIDTDNNKCVSICNPFTWKNQETNICQRQEKCSTQILSKQDTYFSIQIKNFFVYQRNYYVIQSPYFSVYDRTDLYFIKAVQYQINDILAVNVNGIIFVASKDNSISIWDLIKEQRITKKFDAESLIAIKEDTQMFSMQDKYVLVCTIQQKAVSFQIIYNEIHQMFSLSNILKIDINAQSVIPLDQQLFIKNLTQLFIYQLTVTNHDNYLMIENHFILQTKFEENSNYFDIILSFQLGIYLYAQSESIILININNNKLDFIQVGKINNEIIVKTRIFQVANPNYKEYMIISTLNSLVFKSIGTDSSILTILEGYQIKDFEICNLWGNQSQVIVLFENLDLNIFEFDSNLQRFFLFSQTFLLNYYPQFWLKFKYNNQNTDSQENIYELASIGRTSIQIFKKGDIQQQQKKLISIQTITNFDSNFPQQPSNQKIIASQKFKYTFLTIQTNNKLQMTIYDQSDYRNFKFKKQLEFLKYDPSLSFATNNDKLLLYSKQKCLTIYSSELQQLFKNCNIDLIFQTVELNNDLRILLINQENKYKPDITILNITVYQVDLKKETIQAKQKLENLNCTSFQIIKKFSSLKDENKNNFSIEQIVILDNYGNFKIYNLDLSLIYQINLPQKNWSAGIYRIPNNDNFYLLIGYHVLILVDISTNNFYQIQVDIFIYGLIEDIKEISQKINLSNKTYYHIKIFKNNLIYEYQMDFFKNIIYLSSLQSVRSGFFLSLLDEKKGYSKLFQNTQQFVFQSFLQAKYVSVSSSYITFADIFTNQQFQIEQDYVLGNYQMIKNDQELLVWDCCYDTLLVQLVDLSQNMVKYTYFIDFQVEINGINYDEYENLFYLFGEKLFILNSQLEEAYEIYGFNSGYTFLKCFNSQQKLICLVNQDLSFEKFQFYILFYTKATKAIFFVYIGIQEDINFYDIDVDILNENILIFENSKFLIYNFNGFLKQAFDKSIQSCKIQTSVLLCQTLTKIVLIDRISLVLTELDFPDNNQKLNNYYYIDFLNYVIFSTDEVNYQISIVDVSINKIINNFSTRLQLNKQNKPKIKEFQIDQNSNSIMCLDEQGTFYIFSIDKNYYYQSYVQISEALDEKINFYQFTYYNITNDILITGNQVFKIYYDQLGWQYEPQIIEPYHYFAKIINNQQTDYLIFKKYNNTLYRYQSQKLKFELDINGQRIVDILYNQKNDVLLIGLEDSLLFYQLYQYGKNHKLQPNIHQLDNIQFQQFINDNLIITYDQKILHLNIQDNQIIFQIQFNSTQFVTSYCLSENQDYLIVGFSDGQVLLYNLINQIYFTLGIINNDPQNTSINYIQFKEKSDNQKLAFVVSNTALLLQIDLINKQVKQIDLKVLVNENPNILLNKFLIDQNYQRYIFCFRGQKKAYVWNFSKQELEQYLFMPSMYINKLKIEESYLFIQCSFQINVFSLDNTIKFLSVIKKNFLKDTIIDFKLVISKVIVIFYEQKMELFLVSGTNIPLVSQHYYSNPHILDYFFDLQSKQLKILGFHQTGIFENDYNLDLILNNQIDKCNLLISSSGLNNIQHEINQIYPIKTQIQTVDGSTLINKQNQQNNIYSQIQDFELKNLIDQTTQLKDQELIISTKNIQNNIVPLYNDTFSNLNLRILQLANFNFHFQNYTNLEVNITQNKNTQQVVFQNITFNFYCFGSNQIIIKNIEKIVFQNIKITDQDLQRCANFSQENSLFYFYNISQIFIYDLEISSNNFYQISKFPIFQFNISNSIFIKGVSVLQNTNLNNFVNFLNIQNVTLQNVKVSNNVDMILNKQSSGIFSFYMCEIILINTCLFKFNNKLLLINSKNFYDYQKQTVELKEDVLVFKNIQIEQNKFTDENIIMIQSSYIQFNNFTYNQNEGTLLLSQSQNITIIKGNFYGNKAKNGGAIYFSNVQNNIQIEDSVFEQNAAQSCGGALYFQNIASCKVVFGQMTVIKNNKALIGGGLRIVQTDQKPIKLPAQFPFSNNVFQNIADIYGKDSASYLQNMIIENIDEESIELFKFSSNQADVPYEFQNQFSRYAELREFRSGEKINFKVYLADNENRYLNFSKENLQNGKYPDEIDSELKNIQIQIYGLESNKTLINGPQIINYLQYNTSTQAYEIKGLQVLGSLKYNGFFSINSNILTTSINKKPTLLSIDFRNCKVGEVIQQINEQIFICNQCLEGTYQIIDPQTLFQQSINEKKDLNRCINCPESAITCKGNVIELKNGFWRQNNYTDEIIACDPIINSCQAQNPNSIDYCLEGYLGPICEQCDILGEVWKENRYSESISKGVCQICGPKLTQWIYYILKIIIFEAYFLYVIGVFIKKFKYSQTCYYLRKLKVMPISSNSISDYSGFYIKIILNYYQLSYLLIQQPKIISVNFNFLNDLFGSGGSQIQYFTKALTCKSIGNQLYNPIDLTVQCYDISVVEYLYPFSVMVLSFWTLFPLAILRLVKQNQYKLDLCLIKYKYGYYYGELNNYKYLTLMSIVFLLCYYIKIISQNNPFISNSIQQSEIAAYTFILLKIFLLVMQIQIPQSQRFVEIGQIIIDYFFFLSYLIIVFGMVLSSSQSKCVVFIKNQLLKLIPLKSFNKLVNYNRVSFQAYMKWRLVYKKFSKSYKPLKKIKQQQNAQKVQFDKTNRNQKHFIKYSRITSQDSFQQFI
ncbi:hypothetical protein ABPG72_011153 [Tetrahymena utriculariae]